MNDKVQTSTKLPNDELSQLIGSITFKDVSTEYDKSSGGSQFAHHADWGSITVLHRLTGFGHMDIETGFRDPDGRFWLASGNFSIRDHPDLTITEAIETIKVRANVCVGS